MKLSDFRNQIIWYNRSNNVDNIIIDIIRDFTVDYLE